MKIKDRFFLFIEIMFNSIKFNGLIFGLHLFLHAIWCRFVAKEHSASYKIFGFKVNYHNKQSVLNLILEMFGFSVYYFNAKSDEPVIIDVGANIGDSAIYFSWLYPKAKIYAFEPNPGAYRLLEKNIKDNKLESVALFDFGLSDVNGSFEFYDDDSQMFNLGSHDESFLKKTIQDAPTKTIRKITINTKRASQLDLFHQLDRIDLLKIDIEGAESNVLKDMAPFFSKIQQIIFEYHMLPDLDSNSFDYIVNLLRKHGFTVTVSGFERNTENFGNQEVFMINAFKHHE